MQATKEIKSAHDELKSISGRRVSLYAALATIVLLMSMVSTSVAPLDTRSQALGNAGSPVRSQYFAITGKVVRGTFLSTFERYGLERIGYPLSDERIENNRAVQYFERVKMESHPELASQGYSVLLTRLGVDIAGAPFSRVPTFQSSASRVYIPQTGHSLSQPFLTFWQRNGAVEFFGYPISEPMQQDGLTVQWFERARMEYHPELAARGTPVLLTHLGKLAFERNAVPSSASQAPGQPVAQPARTASEVKTSDFENSVLKAINEQRTAVGLRPVQIDGALTELTRARSTDMAARNYFSHTTPEGLKFLDMLTSSAISYKYAGEILARNNYSAADAAPTAMSSYLKSAPHKAVMLDGRYTHIGVGHAFSTDSEMHYFTVIFIER